MGRIFAALLVACLCCCTSRPEVVVTGSRISSGYLGNGAEWDPYDEAESWGSALGDEDWAKLATRVGFMRPGFVRCMINSPFRYYDPGSGRFDPERKSASLLRLLGICKEMGTDVFFGEFNPPEWEMKGSEEWVDMSVAYLDWLVSVKGMDCIKGFIIFNEPDGNWAPVDGDYGLWKSMMLRFKAKMSEYPGLDGVTLLGPDAVMGYRNPASPFGTEGWLRQTVEDLDSLVGIYEVHAYPGQHEVRSGLFAGQVRSLKEIVPEGKKLVLGEAGYKYWRMEDSLLNAEAARRLEGNKVTKGSDSNVLCGDFFYGLDLALLAMEAMNEGLSGMAIWMMDDAMHSNGDSGKPEDLKVWGFWNILGEEVFGDPSLEEIKPPFFPWSLMCRYFPAGCDVLRVDMPGIGGLEGAAALMDGRITAAFVNTADSAAGFCLKLPHAMRDGKLYEYVEGGLALDADGLPLPAETGIRGRNLKLSVPARSFVLITGMD